MVFLLAWKPYYILIFTEGFLLTSYSTNCIIPLSYYYSFTNQRLLLYLSHLAKILTLHKEINIYFLMENFPHRYLCFFQPWALTHSLPSSTFLREERGSGNNPSYHCVPSLLLCISSRWWLSSGVWSREGCPRSSEEYKLRICYKTLTFHRSYHRSGIIQSLFRHLSCICTQKHKLFFYFVALSGKLI